MAYRVRRATLDDSAVLVRHRLGMFSDMSVDFDASTLGPSFARWLSAMMPSGQYRAWLVEDHDGADEGGVVAGAGLTILPWPPGPQYPGGRIAFVYNVYTEPAHRRRGLARLLMTTIHDWCRAEEIGSVALNASADGQSLYVSLGYKLSTSPMMYFPIVGV
jgi:GNAT superfamily N-acetyltransferase